ncbi:MAG: N-acetyltransferase [Cellulomonas sp. 73-145]|uniref:GNAT family N-acetyltransferase n=1 Tax=Cellulomonas sp. 73-145 TaxID=1895739 RepID=UPI000929ED4B|nr:GNAT family N-acetyltransferase [Cellulomonas sp. 73-145]MBN9327961.1 GNAT family N-acetyltransferase [Cellulomonas sp.]OJV57812.1 MAG: N-acetyltransferase [Cellulomonas sp. 73-145]
MTADVTRLPVAVRVARGEDEQAAGELTAQAYQADGLLLAADPYEEELRDAHRRAREATLLVAAVPTGDGRDAVVGSLTLAPYGSSYAEVAEPEEVELRMLAVAPEARRRGVAEELLQAALREAVDGGARRVVLSTLDVMTGAQRLYARLGFEPRPDRDWHHGDVHLLVHVWTAPAAPGVLVEVATWTPTQVVDVDGWRVGLSGGLTRRANSVVALGEPADPVAALERVEMLYADQGLPSVFRIGHETRPSGLDAVLEARGYGVVTRTDVLVRGLDVQPEPGASPRQVAGLHLSDEPDDDWLEDWLAGKSSSGSSAAGLRGAGRALLTGAPARYLSVHDGGRLVGRVRVAFAEGWAGVSCLAVDPSQRRRGLGRALTLAALDEARQAGARRAFLQVEAANSGAARLYAGLGFRPAQRYAYRERPLQ